MAGHSVRGRSPRVGKAVCFFCWKMIDELVVEPKNSEKYAQVKLDPFFSRDRGESQQKYLKPPPR